MQHKPINTYHLNESVRVKNGVHDPDFGSDISGWQGRIREIDEESEEEHIIYLIAWDSVTLKEMDLESITRSEEEGLGWDSMYLYEEDIEPASPRDSEREVTRAIEQIQQDLEQGFSDLTNKAV